jgi:hypothetical protein
LRYLSGLNVVTAFGPASTDPFISGLNERRGMETRVSYRINMVFDKIRTLSEKLVVRPAIGDDSEATVSTPIVSARSSACKPARLITLEASRSPDVVSSTLEPARFVAV